MIPFNIPPKTGNELKYIEQAIQSDKLCGDGHFSKKCEAWLEENFNTAKALLTPSCTAALELAAILIDIKEGDEVIMPSYTFVSTANAFVLRGAKIIFVDVRPDTMNMDESLVEAAITPNTRAIVPVHYAGVACEMDTILGIAEKYNLWVIEDAAQGVMSTYKDKALGTIGHIGCYSFHETKNYSSGGEGGAILINDPELVARAEIIREKGTNRSQFLHGLVDKYTWQDVGSSFLPSELQAAYLYAQLESAERINNFRLSIWDRYYEALSQKLQAHQLPNIPDSIQHNAHMFYIKLGNFKQRQELITHLKECGVTSVFHYIPLHSTAAGQMFSRFNGEDRYTTKESEVLLRLPLYYSISDENVELIIGSVLSFFTTKV
ncbi:dTDP-4-amino-4,6-dideoxygalactose transaminase [Pseudoalteromonas sp. DL2-H2.2]|uniref:dTDP-4-amino-4,6-dideoxygalactose transaminase n=1 Tax=Pseudoalteromonas sp. DL2-H2.2 TaxID=2908889 RepID=UPI001F2B9369|nr:dTDP-4-amino-4,6-dideoxygalactose transaminase [Pseudoalteromonas sp. DL2-H2.2]MCF2908841.1 dTDP-4-amino-4,6-dideoxygalactose transaminase [Pseudoalteromonas sp. DL2-H2.2]